MYDSRLDQLARVLIRHSTKLQKAEHVLIELFDAPDEMGIALIRASRDAGAVPFLQIHRAQVSRELALEAEEAQLGTTSVIEIPIWPFMIAVLIGAVATAIQYLLLMVEDLRRAMRGRPR